MTSYDKAFYFILTHENSTVFNKLDEIFLVFVFKKVNILYLFHRCDFQLNCLLCSFAKIGKLQRIHRNLDTPLIYKINITAFLYHVTVKYFVNLCVFRRFWALKVQNESIHFIINNKNILAHRLYRMTWFYCRLKTFSSVIFS